MSPGSLPALVFPALCSWAGGGSVAVPHAHVIVLPWQVFEV